MLGADALGCVGCFSRPKIMTDVARDSRYLAIRNFWSFNNALRCLIRSDYDPFAC